MAYKYGMKWEHISYENVLNEHQVQSVQSPQRRYLANLYYKYNSHSFADSKPLVRAVESCPLGLILPFSLFMRSGLGKRNCFSLGLLLEPQDADFPWTAMVGCVLLWAYEGQQWNIQLYISVRKQLNGKVHAFVTVLWLVHATWTLNHSPFFPIEVTNNDPLSISLKRTPHGFLWQSKHLPSDTGPPAHVSGSNTDYISFCNLYLLLVYIRPIVYLAYILLFNNSVAQQASEDHH